MDIHEFASSHNMKLNNPGKCKEMFINCMHDHNILVNPIIMGSKEIECVSNYKLLGVYLNEDLNWNTHIDVVANFAKSWRCVIEYLKGLPNYYSTGLGVCCSCMAINTWYSV
jgi:hypothetical protein